MVEGGRFRGGRRGLGRVAREVREAWGERQATRRQERDSNYRRFCLKCCSFSNFSSGALQEEEIAEKNQ